MSEVWATLSDEELDQVLRLIGQLAMTDDGALAAALVVLRDAAARYQGRVALGTGAADAAAEKDVVIGLRPLALSGSAQ